MALAALASPANDLLLFCPADHHIPDALQTHAPDILEVCRKAKQQPQRDGHFIRPDAKAFATCRSQSIDYAVMEPLSQQPALTLTLSQRERELTPPPPPGEAKPLLPLPPGEGRGEGGISVFPFTGQWSDVGSWNAVANPAGLPLTQARQ